MVVKPPPLLVPLVLSLCRYLTAVRYISCWIWHRLRQWSHNQWKIRQRLKCYARAPPTRDWCINDGALECVYSYIGLLPVRRAKSRGWEPSIFTELTQDRMNARGTQSHTGVEEGWSGRESDHSCLYSVISLFLNSLRNVFSSPTPWFSHTWLKPYLYNRKHTDEAHVFRFCSCK